ncbi:hypothetical protein HY635_04145 [Candidatus Uhrbacteria bacterium]|nr:hypothetical protein [Candidatus Uhrbacteria bacterium]
MRISQIEVGVAYQRKQDAREALAAEGYAVDVERCHEQLEWIRTHPFQQIDAAMKRRDLTFEEAYAGMCYVLRATNGVFAAATEEYFRGLEISDYRLAGREFLNGMAVKEAWGQVTPEEIAGMVSAARLDLVVALPFNGRIFETCGTGGDVGLPPRDAPRKVINVSTLTSLVLAALDVPTTKHGSYANTSAVGSTDALERFGVIVEQRSRAEIERLFQDVGYCFTDAHVVKTIHDLSHLAPKHETVNHLIGPMTPPVAAATRLDKVMGVNEKVHPEDVAKAFAELHRRGIQAIGNVAVVTGLDADIDAHSVLRRRLVKDHAILDELSPYSSVVAFVRGGAYTGTFLLHPSDFGVRCVNASVALENRLEVLVRANEAALRGRDPALADYLAMNAGLALYTVEHLDADGAFHEDRGPNRELLAECARRCRTAIAEERPWDLLRRFVEATGGTLRSV